MGFVDAVRACLSNYATFSGRARRPEYWWFVLFGLLASVGAALIDAALLGGAPDTGPVSAIVSLALFLPSLAAGWRRLHDVGQSGWWMAAPFAASLPLVVGTLMAATQTGGALVGASMLVGGLLTAAAWAFLLFRLASRSQPGPNRFGPEPAG